MDSGVASNYKAMGGLWAPHDQACGLVVVH